MRTTLIAVTVILGALPAHAVSWSDIGCSSGLVAEGMDFRYTNQEGANAICKLTAAQELSCDDGKTRKLVALPDDQVMLDEVRMFLIGGNNLEVCD